MARRAALPCAIFVVCALVFTLTLGARALEPSHNNHFVHLAQSFLHGQLAVLGDRPPGTNDWALYEGRWYVSFPAFPAVVIMPAVAIWGEATLDRLFWAILAGLAPALLFVLLRRLSERGVSTRGLGENLLLTGLFAFGTVFFFVAVQGEVWFAAHVVASSLMVLFLLCALDLNGSAEVPGRRRGQPGLRPVLAGVCLGLSFLTRTTTLLAALVFLVEALRTYRRSDIILPADAHPLRVAAAYVRSADLPRVVRACALFSVPIVIAIGVQLWMNDARFDDPLTFGHEFLQVKWRGRIEKYGLFDYHYLGKNLGVALASLPWFTSEAPYVKISLHGLALWVTTPNLLWLLWPRRVDARLVGLMLGAFAIALLNLCYQNSGWVQFGYRFALDYMPLLIVLLALGGRRFGPGFAMCAVLAVVINAFGAATFDRSWRFYDNDRTQNRVFEPD
jgi:hypothetical protein